MSVEKWREWIELVALITVVGSLVALIVELRQTQVALRAQAYQARAFDGIQWNMDLAKDASIREMQDRFTDPEFDPTSLSPSEWSVASRLITVVRIDLDNEHYQFQSGFLDAGFYYGETVERIRARAPIWRAMGHISPRQEFRVEVDRILEENLE